MSNKGQALLEFILILPVFLMLFIGIIDFGRIIYEKNKLENVMGDVIDMINLNYPISEIDTELKTNYNKNINLKINTNNNKKTIKLNTDIDLYMLGLDLVLPDPFPIKTSRVIHNE
ncbi:MAG: pilus assembly protein [Bacilli bacterium]|jgi:Flp pilus assembly protein TadG|nr:pilus assembly protein [Bacilli bacterium]